MKPTPRELQETYKTYERVVDHLISEGYADDKESADKIIEGMSETWYHLIIADWGHFLNCPLVLPSTAKGAMITK